MPSSAAWKPAVAAITLRSMQSARPWSRPSNAVLATMTAAVHPEAAAPAGQQRAAGVHDCYVVHIATPGKTGPKRESGGIRAAAAASPKMAPVVAFEIATACPARVWAQRTRTGTFMTMRAIAAAAGARTSGDGCSQPAPAAETAQAEEKPWRYARQDDPFRYAVNYECDGGGKIDIVFDRGSAREALVRVDGAAPVTLPMNPSSQTGIEYKSASATLGTDGSDHPLDLGRASQGVQLREPAPSSANCRWRRSCADRRRRRARQSRSRRARRSPLRSRACRRRAMCGR